MSTPKIDLPHLAAFVAAYDCSSMARAAEALDLTTSALSARLHGLEKRLDLQLFARHGRTLLPLLSAVWLYNRSVRLLLAEEFLRSRVANGPDGPVESFAVRLDEAYTGTLLAQAVIDAIRQVHSSRPTCFIDLVVAKNAPTDRPADRSLLLDNGTDGHEVVLRVANAAGASTDTALSIMPWVKLGAEHHEPDTDESMLKDLLVPDLPGNLNDDFANHLRRTKSAHHISSAAVSLQDYFGIARLFTSHDLLIPLVLAPTRMIASGSSTAFVPDAPTATIQMTATQTTASLGFFVDVLRPRLAEDRLMQKSASPFRPMLTLRQIGALNLVLKTGSMRSAARVAGLTAPMIPMQLANLETALATTLIHRDRGGARPTDLAKNLAPLCLAIENSFNDAIGMSRKVAAEFQQSVRVGLPPSWSSDSRTSECMAVALSGFHGEFPECRIEVVEGPRDMLHGGIRSGQLNIAIVGNVSPQVGSIAIGTSEDISLIVNKDVGFQPHSGRVSSDELRRIPLILAPAHVTMHQTLLSALAKTTVQLEPVMRLGSVPLIVSVIRRSPFGTILPPSVVRNELEAGLVQAFPLDHIVPRRRLWVIFSTDNPLSEVERRLVQHIKDAFVSAG